MNVGDSPSFAAIQDKCGRVAHTPFAASRFNRDFPSNGRSAEIKLIAVSFMLILWSALG